MGTHRHLLWLWLVGLFVLWRPTASAQTVQPTWQHLPSGNAWRPLVSSRNFSPQPQLWCCSTSFAPRLQWKQPQSALISSRYRPRPSSRDRLGVMRQAQSAIDGGAVILALPTLIIDFVPLLGNVVALSSGMGRFGWGIAGIGMSAVGTLLMIPTFGITAIAIALGLLQATLMGLSVTNLILALLERRARAKEINAIAALSPDKQLMVSFGF